MLYQNKRSNDYMSDDAQERLTITILTMLSAGGIVSGTFCCHVNRSRDYFIYVPVELRFLKLPLVGTTGAQKTFPTF